MTEPDPARARYFAITGLRIAGAGLAVFGIVVLSGRVEGLPVIAGYLMLMLGLAEMTIVPRLLARRWRSPPDKR